MENENDTITDEEMVEESPDDLLTGEEQGADLATEDSDMADDIDDETPVNLHDEHGRFRKGHPGGPGRGKIGVGTTRRQGKPKGGGGFDVFDEITNAISQEGSEEFFRKLCRKSPVTVSQLLAGAQKTREAAGEQAEPCTVIVGTGIMAPCSSMREIDRIVTDLDDMDLDAAKREIARLRRELTQRESNGITPKAKQEPVICPTCKLLGHERSIEPGGRCCCGQSHYLASMGKPEPLPTTSPTHRPFNDACYSEPADSFIPIDDLSSESIRNAQPARRGSSSAAGGVLARLSGRGHGF